MAIHHVYACLVHESPDCVLDLAKNLRRLDPGSTILLYDGSRDRRVLPERELGNLGVQVHPNPQPMVWGRLHGFALDCVDFVERSGGFDLMTIVDSDQLLLRPGYVEFLEANVRLDGLGLLSSSPGRQGPTCENRTVRSAWRDVRRWRPWLSRFRGGETREGALAVLERFRTDRLLLRTLRQTRVGVTEEILFPTLLTLLGFRVDRNPCRQDWVRYRVGYSLADCDAALAEPAAFFMHPVPRRIDDPIRSRIRSHHDRYA
jgi:hypothetical protein